MSNYVWHGADGTEFGMRGAYREIAPPERLVNTEAFASPGTPVTLWSRRSWSSRAAGPRLRNLVQYRARRPLRIGSGTLG